MSGLLALAFINSWIVMGSPSIEAQSTEEEQLLLNAAFGFGLASWLAIRLGRPLAQRDAVELQERSSRPGELLLRSFGDDKLRVLVVPSLRHSVIERLGFRFLERLEETISWTLSEVGPLIAVANPRKRMRRLWAAKQKMATDEWRALVESHAVASRAIVMIIGRTPGLLEEVDLIVANDLVGQTIFVVPPLDANEVDARWNAVVNRLGLNGTWDLRDGTLAIVVSNNREIRIVSDRRQAPSYESALRAVFDHELVGAASPEVERAEPRPAQTPQRTPVASATVDDGIVAGWYRDPWGRSSLRYWDGARWTH